MTGPMDWDRLVLGPCQAVFGESVQWLQGGSSAAITLTGIFDNGWKPMDVEIVDGITPSHVVSADARLGVQLSQFATQPAQGDIFIIRGSRWIVREVMDDSHGGADILLNKADKINDPLPGSTARQSGWSAPPDY
ncbi:hypothetical protein K2X14_07710 [Acetobacter sp. TBRC 12305]|nr:hypothetical protein [Acetobacter garciniae]MBX0344718.1 hypothetical protein [Acetobacter garciniae]